MPSSTQAETSALPNSVYRILINTVRVSCAVSRVTFCNSRRTRPTRGGSIAVAPRPLAFCGKSRRFAVPSVFMPAVRTACDALPARRRLSRRPCRSSGGHVHLCAIFYANQSHKIKRLNFVHCYFGTDVSVCAESGLSRPVSGACCNGCRKNRG